MPEMRLAITMLDSGRGAGEAMPLTSGLRENGGSGRPDAATRRRRLQARRTAPRGSAAFPTATRTGGGHPGGGPGQATRSSLPGPAPGLPGSALQAEAARGGLERLALRLERVRPVVREHGPGFAGPHRLAGCQRAQRGVYLEFEDPRLRIVVVPLLVDLDLAVLGVDARVAPPLEAYQQQLPGVEAGDPAGRGREEDR